MPHEAATDREWNSVTTPFDVDLRAVVQTNRGPFAVGGSGTVVANTGDGWEAVVTEGPGKQNRALSSIDVTADGDRVWYAGASGAIGMYDVANGEQYDFSYSKDISASWSAVAVAGRAGTERVSVANTSGKVLPLSLSGREATYGAPATPGGGSEITALEATTAGTVFATDTAGTVYETTKSGWTTTGVDAASVSLRDVTVGPDGQIYVAGANGTLYVNDGAEQGWTANEVTGAALRAVDVLDGHVVVLSANNKLFRRPVDGRTRWQESAPPTNSDLLALALGAPDVAVGKAGTVVTREAPEPPAESKSEAKPERSPVCDLLTEELIGRLEREELVALLERKETCESPVVELLAERRAEPAGELTGLLQGGTEANVVVLPVAAAGGLGEIRSERRHATCECHGEATGRSALERLICD
ncbi:hypothetical protein OB920_19680 [Halobacteria archaeon HArc-gm2]|nr:hypothetical protein [Halobacteria archaeon HArc-gm2]